MTGSSGRKTVSVMRGVMMLCDICYQDVLDEKLTDNRNYVENHEALFDAYVRVVKISTARWWMIC